MQLKIAYFLEKTVMACGTDVLDGMQLSDIDRAHNSQACLAST
jgi:hypothetical protein